MSSHEQAIVPLLYHFALSFDGAAVLCLTPCLCRRWHDCQVHLQLLRSPEAPKMPRQSEFSASGPCSQWKAAPIRGAGREERSS
ncbi:hypothetical protein NL676_028257 [Syzygium grande]|nr:hypothetical protein NL676_028257 [Syzygium grande]